jgi:hypothetical protein
MPATLIGSKATGEEVAILLDNDGGLAITGLSDLTTGIGLLKDAIVANTAVLSGNAAFVPAGTVVIACTAVAGHVILPDTGDTLMVVNSGPNVAFIKLGVDGVVAVVTDLAVPALGSVTISRNHTTQTYIGGICAAGETANLSITAGSGRP